MNRAVVHPSFVFLSAATFVVYGCSPDNGLNLAKVRGKVTYKGVPVRNGTVFFMPDESKGTIGPPAVGSITSDGSFIMSTESAGDGVIVGSHKIGVTGVEEKPVGSGAAAPTPESDAKAYMNAKAKDAAAARSGAVKRRETPSQTRVARGGGSLSPRSLPTLKNPASSPRSSRAPTP